MARLVMEKVNIMMNVDALAIRDFCRLLIKRTDLTPAALQVIVAEYATQICDTEEDATYFEKTVWHE